MAEVSVRHGSLIRMYARGSRARDLLLFIALAGACSDASRNAGAASGRPVSAHTTMTPVTQFADSAAADSEALAMLPPARQADFDVLHLLSDAALSDSSRAYCQPFADTTDRDVRRRLRSEWPEPWVTVLFVRADRRTGALRRVELVRRRKGGSQNGYIWDGESDETRTIEWTAQGQQEYTLPEGTPMPRALRGLGRRLLVAQCQGEPFG